MDEERDDANHPLQVVVEAPVDVREAEDEIAKAVAARVRVDERLTGDLRRRVRALRVREVRHLLAVLLEAVDVAVHLAAGREDDRDLLLPDVLEDVVGHDQVLERPMRLPDELVHLRVRGEMDDQVDLRILDAVDSARERRIVAREVLEEIAELVCPCCPSFPDRCG